MRNVKIDEVDRLDRDVVALGNDYAQGFILPPHQHRRAQLLYGATGLMYVTTQDGEWVVPPQHAVWIPPETVHAVRFAGVTTRSLYIEPDCVAAFIKHRRCEVISVSPLLRQLLLEAVDLPPLYDSPRDRALIQLMLLELAAMPVREFDIPLPQHPALLALCQAFLLNPSIHDPAARWARALFMSPSTFRHHVPPRDRAAAVVLSPSLMRRGRGLRQHVSEMNVAFMALLCVYAVIRQIIQEGLASSSGTPTFSGGYIQAVYLFCL